MKLPMRRQPLASRWLLLATFACSVPATLRAANPQFPPGQIEFFESRVRPVLAGTCQKCHGAATHKGGLRLVSRDAALKGGDSGAAVVPGNPDASLMIEAVNYRGLEMPPTGKLKPREIEALVEWVKMGAPWPKEKPEAKAAAPSRGDFTVTDEDRRYWAFQPIGHPQPPPVGTKGWAADPIDAFILAQLEAKGLVPNPPAEPRALIRRAFFDVIGLPPTPEEVDAFAANPSEQAYARLIDNLLSRKEYGERWGRHWLDVVRFAQTNGYERDAEKPESWRYRDYVIDAFNSDKPYDQFVTEQLAGDELNEPTAESIIATGFYRLGIFDDEPDNQAAAAWDEVDEMVRTTGAAFLGLTLGCARCHNHMFDPIPQDDYYRLAAFFRNVEPYGKALSHTHLGTNEAGIFTPVATNTQFANWKSRRAELAPQIAKLKAKLAKLPKDAKRTERQRLVGELTRLKQLQDSALEKALSVRECGPPLRETRVLIRGNVATPGKRVEPRFLTILGGKAPQAIPVSFTGPAGDHSLKPMLAEYGLKPTMGLRRELAKWIVSNDNPLTARVTVNRIWQGYFGRGIVRSTDNFGRAGTPPTHPELLAWLARDFVDGDWRLKRMHKRILLSHAYRMSSEATNDKARALDADNDLFWRQNLRRLDAEAIRDSMLAVSGTLNPAAGGRGVFPPLSKDVLATQSRPGLGWGTSSAQEQSRRSVYVYLKRTLMVPFFEAFDYTNTAESVGTRPVTTVAPQALLLLNSEFADREAKNLAERIRCEAGDAEDRQIERLFRLALGRKPTAREIKIANELLRRKAEPDSAADPLRSLCLVVLNLNEFIYLD